MGQNRFTSRIVTDWNTLLEDVVNAVSVNDFKNKLDEYFDDDHLCTIMIHKIVF